MLDPVWRARVAEPKDLEGGREQEVSGHALPSRFTQSLVNGLGLSHRNITSFGDIINQLGPNTVVSGGVALHFAMSRYVTSQGIQN